MTVQTMAPPMRGQMQQSFRLAVPVLVIGLLLFGVLFHAEVAAAVTVWMDSTAYNHCFLVLPIVAYLVWDRREVLASTPSIPNPLFAVLAIPVVVVWLLAERLGIMEGRQLMMMTLVEIFLLSVLGWRLYYRMIGPLLYLYFLVPFGAFLTPQLQGFTTSFVVHGLNLLNIPNYSDGFAIEIPEGSFLVAEACAGLRFLIASIAFGCLYVMLMYRSPLRRAIFIAASIVVPIIANGFRALGIVVLGHVLGSAEAGTADHLIYGWLFFSVVILLLIALGLPFREDHRVPPVVAPVRTTRPVATRETSVRADARGNRGVRRRSMPWHERAMAALQRSWEGHVAQSAAAPARPATLRGFATAAAVAVVIAAAGPAAAMALSPKPSSELPATLRPIDFTGACTTDPDQKPEQHDGVGRLWVEHLKCGKETFTLRIEVFPPRTPPSSIVSELRVLSGEAGDVVNAAVYLSTPEGAHTWRVLELRDPAGMIASSLWIDGRPSDTSFNMRMRRAWASVFGSAYAPIAISLTPDLDWANPNVALRNRARDLIALFVQTYKSLPEQITRLSYTAAR